MPFHKIQESFIWYNNSYIPSIMLHKKTIHMIKDTVIETQRLTIRPYIPKDASAVFSVQKDKAIYDYLPDKPYESLEEVEGLIEWIINEVLL